MSTQSRRLKRRLAAIPHAVKSSVLPAIEKSADEIADAMRHLVPVRTGDLQESIVVTPAGQATPAYSQPGGSTVVPENSVMITAGNTDVRYAHLVEYGTIKTEAHPFFWPSFRLFRKKAQSRIRRSISKAIRNSKT